MYFECGRIRLRIDFLSAAVIAFFLLTQDARSFCILLLSAAAHEAGHICVLLHAGVPRITVDLHPGGAAIRDISPERLSYRQTFAAALAGPAVNLFAAAVFFTLKHVTAHQIFVQLCSVHFMLGAVNLLPLSFLDGGTALFSLLSERKKTPVPPDMTAVDTITLLCMSAGCLFLIFTGRTAYYALAFTGYCILSRFLW